LPSLAWLRLRGWLTRFPKRAAILWIFSSLQFTACLYSLRIARLQNLSSLLADTKAQETHDLVRYVFSLLYLERKFAANTEMVSVVRSRLNHTSFRAEHFSNNVNELCHSISGIYEDTLSNHKFRIKVSGSAQHLQDPKKAQMIRTVLLAGVRSAFLWRQLGGHRWGLLLYRKKLLRSAQNLSRGLGVV
jgi:high frequency lysogenization protein